MKAAKGTASQSLTFRFPKTHTEYEYVTDQNQPTGIKETINRDNVGRFICENEKETVDFPFTVALSNKEAGTTFLAGNPFMAHIDIEKFMTANKITSVKVYDATTPTHRYWSMANWSAMERTIRISLRCNRSS